MSDQESRGPLADVTVVEFAGLTPVSVAGMLLAGMGAEVIRVDRREHPADSGGNTLRRGRRSIVLDLKHPKGNEIARRLVGTADVLLEGYRPGVMERLGLGPETLRPDNRGRPPPAGRAAARAARLPGLPQRVLPREVRRARRRSRRGAHRRRSRRPAVHREAGAAGQPGRRASARSARRRGPPGHGPGPGVLRHDRQPLLRGTHRERHRDRRVPPGGVGAARVRHERTAIETRLRSALNVKTAVRLVPEGTLKRLDHVKVTLIEREKS